MELRLNNEKVEEIISEYVSRVYNIDCKKIRNDENKCIGDIIIEGDDFINILKPIKEVDVNENVSLRALNKDEIEALNLKPEDTAGKDFLGMIPEMDRIFENYSNEQIMVLIDLLNNQINDMEDEDDNSS